LNIVWRIAQFLFYFCGMKISKKLNGAHQRGRGVKDLRAEDARAGERAQAHVQKYKYKIKIPLGIQRIYLT
jgi:hypothetical protein